MNMCRTTKPKKWKWKQCHWTVSLWGRYECVMKGVLCFRQIAGVTITITVSRKRLWLRKLQATTLPINSLRRDCNKKPSLTNYILFMKEKTGRKEMIDCMITIIEFVGGGETHTRILSSCHLLARMPARFDMRRHLPAHCRRPVSSAFEEVVWLHLNPLP